MKDRAVKYQPAKDRTVEYQTAIEQELNKLYQDYLQRLVNHPTGEEKHVTLMDAGKYLTSLAGLGSMVGAVSNPLVGVAVSVTGTALALGIEEGKNIYDNKKLENALLVINYLMGIAANTFKATAKQVVLERKPVLNLLADNQETTQKVAKYLAKNIMSAIKDNAKTNSEYQKDIVQLMSDKLLTANSKKTTDKTVKIEHSDNERRNSNVSLEAIKAYRLNL